MFDKLMFFGNRLPQVLGDLGKGMRAFKEGMNEGGSDEPKPKRSATGRKPVKKVVVRKTSKTAK